LSAPEFWLALKKPHGGRRRSRPTAPPKGKPRGSPRAPSLPREPPCRWAGQRVNGQTEAPTGGSRGPPARWTAAVPPPNVYRSRVFAHGLNYPRAEVEIYPRAAVRVRGRTNCRNGRFLALGLPLAATAPMGEPPSRLRPRPFSTRQKAGEQPLASPLLGACLPS